MHSSDSLRSVLEEDGHDPFRFYEAEICTYPTKFLTKDIAKLFVHEFKIDVCWLSLQLHERGDGEVFVPNYRDSILEYDSKTSKFSKFDGSFDCNGRSACYIKADVKYVEGDVAGKIVYAICFPDKDAVHLSPGFIKKLIESGDRFGYDYIAYTVVNGIAETLVHVSFESKRQDSEIEIEDKLYHVAPSRLKDKILKFGLTPHGTDYKTVKDGNKMHHPHRVYLFNGLDIWAMKSFLAQSAARKL